MQREIHNHGGRRYHAAYVYRRGKCGPATPRQKPGSRTRLVKTGTLCFYCGFTPSDLTKRIQLRVLERHIRSE